MVVPQSKWSLRQGTHESFPSDRLSESATGQPYPVDESAILQNLKDLAVTGGHNLDAILRAVTEVAQKQTGASGAAVAMWKNGEMICRARSGNIAPPLGARLSSNTGISGECLRTGQRQHCPDTENNPLVDVEVCRSLGLRSIAVLPIQGWRGINGILEVFSTEPRAFSEGHLAFLQQLSAVAERARTFQPQGATGVVTTPIEDLIEVQGILPASDRVRDVAAIFLGGRRRPFVIGGVVLAMFLLGCAIWLGWRGPAEGTPGSEALPQVVSSVEAAPLPDKDSISKEIPAKTSPLQKNSAGNPVKMASKVDVISQSKPRAGRPLLTADAAAMSAVPPMAGSGPVEERLVIEAPPLSRLAPDSALGTVLGSPVSRPELSQSSISRGVADGRLKNAVQPTYPSQAIQMRVQGRVILEATIFEDGTIHDLSVVQGHPLLAKSAVEAVERWRYRPYLLDGHPVRKQMTITVDFKLPSQ